MSAPVETPAPDKAPDMDEVRALLTEAGLGDTVSFRALAKTARTDDRNLAKFMRGTRNSMAKETVGKLAAALPADTAFHKKYIDLCPDDVRAAPQAAEPDAHAVRLDRGRIVFGQNYRQTFDEDEIAGLALSIRERGLIQPIVVFPAGSDGTHRLNAGERRLRAIDKLIAGGDWPPKKGHDDGRIPCVVGAYSDEADARIDALIENLQRENVPIHEEAAGVAAMRDLSWSAELISLACGKSKRFAEQRLNFHDKLIPEAQKAVARGDLTFDAARALWVYPADLQRKAWKRIKNWDPTPHQVRHEATLGLPRLSDALFDVNDYQGIIVGTKKDRHFADVKEFKERQQVALKETIAKLEKEWAAVTVCDHFPSWNYRQTKDKKKGEAFVVTHTIQRDGVRWTKAEIYEGYCKPERARSPVDPKAKTQKALELSNRQLVQAGHLKTLELQRAVAEGTDEDRGARVAMAATVAALLTQWYAGSVKIVTKHFEPADFRPRGGTPAELMLADLLAPERDAGLIEGTGKDNVLGVAHNAEAALFDALVNSDRLPAIFAATVARTLGTFPGHRGQYGDEALAGSIARAAGADLSGRWTMTEAYLKEFTRAQLPAVARACLTEGGRENFDPADMPSKKTDAIEWILSHPRRDKKWLPPELRYGERDAIEADVAEMLEGKG